MISIVSSYIRLEETFLYYFLNFLHNFYNDCNDYAIKKYIAFAFVSFLKNQNLGERTVLPVMS